MDFIRKKLNRKINFLESNESFADLKIHYQVRVEYMLVYCLAYLWNKNFVKLDESEKEYVLSRIQKPTIGDIEDISRKLDISGEFFFNKKVNAIIKKYPSIRNE